MLLNTSLYEAYHTSFYEKHRYVQSIINEYQ